MPDKDSFTLNVSTTIKSMLKNLYRSKRKINEFGIRNMTYNELKEFFKLVRLIQECNSANDCWPFFRNSKKLRIRIMSILLNPITTKTFQLDSITLSSTVSPNLLTAPKNLDFAIKLSAKICCL